jgi:hypothetical protein
MVNLEEQSSDALSDGLSNDSVNELFKEGVAAESSSDAA